MSAPFTCDAEFLRSITPRQREYFLRRESARHTRLETTLRDLSRGLSTVNELSNETLAMVLDYSVATQG